MWWWLWRWYGVCVGGGGDGGDDGGKSGGVVVVDVVVVDAAAVAEAAVVGVQDEIKGHIIYAYVTLKANITPTDQLKSELNQTVRDSIGALAVPGHIQWAEGLPKTRSGKIMRRLLRKIAEKDTAELGDLSTLADPGVIDELIRQRG